MTETVIHVNGRPLSHSGEARTTLADFVRGVQLTGTHLGCEHGVCGACTVLVDGKPMRSCITYAVQFGDCQVRTIESFDEDDVMTQLRAAFSEFHGLQCGFCTPGMLVTARDIVTRLGNVDEARIRSELAGNLCRCTGYNGIVRAIQKVASSYTGNLEDAMRPLPAPTGPVPAGVSPVAVTKGNPEVLPKDVAAPSVATKESFDTDDLPGAPRISTYFTVPHTIDDVWGLLGNLPAVVRCLPGAELVEHEGERFIANILVGLGPITASIQGAGTYMRDDDQRRARISGKGKDRVSRSEVSAVLTYTLVPQGNETKVDVLLIYQLKGMLAQFARPSLVEDLANGLVKQFASNLGNVLQHGEGAAPISSARLSISRTLAQLVVQQVKRLFRKKPRE